jgi:hypothetical protein
VDTVQVQNEEGTVTEYTDQDGIHKAIWENVQNKWFFLAESAPICNGDLQEQFGYCADTEQAKRVLDGTYQAEEDMDAVTNDLFGEVARVKEAVGSGSIKDIITGEEWSEGWK